MAPVLFILSNPEHEHWALEVSGLLGHTAPLVVHGSPVNATQQLASIGQSPSHIVIDIGQRGHDILPEVDALAEYCDAGTKVVTVGYTNDVSLYRALISRGVADYLPMPVSAHEVVQAFTQAEQAAAARPTTSATSSSRNGRVIACFGAGSGDGASMVALNTAYAVSNFMPGNTVLIDMDYQFGMVAKQIDLQAAFGIRELFDHPERGVDGTLLKRMVAKYGALDVISAPADLRFLPELQPETVRTLIGVLREHYDTVIIDLPHVWLPWVSSVVESADKIVLVAQLWLKSVAHAARLMKAWREMGVAKEKVQIVINRAGAKFKEAVAEEDFERVCGAPIRHRLDNDIRTIGAAEGQAKTVMELPASELSRGLDRLAHALVDVHAGQGDAGGDAAGSGLFSMFKKRAG